MLLHPAAVLDGGLQFARRVVVHLDLDCFYCQVEQKRLSIPRDKPCAVQQWQGLIAVNYAARAAGITRHMRVQEAKQICPELELVHVQTIGSIQPADAPGSGAAAVDAGEGEGEGEGEGSAMDRESSKACLQRYRKASAEIMRLLSQMCPGCMLEKASIDEAYLDITPMAVRELSNAEAGKCPTSEAAAASGAAGVPALLSAAAEASVVLGDGGLQADMDYDRLAAAGAVVALRLRTAVFDQLSFTVSAGIACNKLLAKIGSARNKPNKQTIVLPRAVEALMQDLPLGKVKGLGGKLGARLEELGAGTAGAVAALPWDTLLEHFDAKARWLYNTVRGVDAEPVAAKDKVKSINSCKSFAPTSAMSAVSQWLGVLAQELADRMAEDEAEHTRRPRSLVLQYRGGPVRVPDRSIRGAMPPFKKRDSPDPQVIAASALALFKRISPAPWPLARLALVATEFTDLGGGGAGSGAVMARFLAGAHNRRLQQATPAPQQQQQIGLQQSGHCQVLQLMCEGACTMQAGCRYQPPRQQHAGGKKHQQQLRLQDSPVAGQLLAMPCVSSGSPGTTLAAGEQHPTNGESQGCHDVQQDMGACQQQQEHHQADTAPVLHQHSMPGKRTYAGDMPAIGPVADSGSQDTLLSGVDIAEQAQLLREVELQQLRQRSLQENSSCKKRKQASKTGLHRSRVRSDKQQNIAELFAKRSR